MARGSSSCCVVEASKSLSVQAAEDLTFSSKPLTEDQVLALNHPISKLTDEAAAEIHATNTAKKAGTFNLKKRRGPDAPLCLGWSGIAAAIGAMRLHLPHLADPAGPI